MYDIALDSAIESGHSYLCSPCEPADMRDRTALSLGLVAFALVGVLVGPPADGPAADAFPTPAAADASPSLVGVGVLPIPVAAHRAVVVAAVALVAAGARPARRWTPLLRAGGGLWVVAVVAGHLV